MSVQSYRITVAAIVLSLGVALFPADRARAQCGTTDVVTTFCYIDFGPMTMRLCLKQLKWSVYTPTQPATRGCSPTLNQMSSNVTNCGYIVGQRRLYVSRPATGATMSGASTQIHRPRPRLSAERKRVPIHRSRISSAPSPIGHELAASVSVDHA